MLTNLGLRDQSFDNFNTEQTIVFNILGTYGLNIFPTGDVYNHSVNLSESNTFIIFDYKTMSLLSLPLSQVCSRLVLLH